MMQVIDEDYIKHMYALSDGPARLLGWVTSLIEERDTAQAIARAAANNVKPLVRQNEDLQAANTRLVFEKRDVRFELQAEIDAKAAELDSHRATPKLEKPAIGMLHEVEWAATEDLGEGGTARACPMCSGIEAEGHMPHCRLAALLYGPPFITLAGTPEEAARLIEWFDKRHDLDLSWDAIDNDLSDCAWRVHQQHGSVNDREWKLICHGDTVLDALRAAHKAFCDGR